MRKQFAPVAVLPFGFSCGGHSAVVGTAPAPADVKANATIDISSFHVITQPAGAWRLLASASLVAPIVQ